MNRLQAKEITRSILLRWDDLWRSNGYRLTGTVTGRMSLHDYHGRTVFVDPPYGYRASEEFLRMAREAARDLNVIVMTAQQNSSKGRTVR